MTTSRAARPAPEYIRFPVAVLHDQREKLPYAFRGLVSDKADGGHPWLVDVRPVFLETGDYTLDGYADRVAVERKSLEDLFCTLGQHRDRFEHELHRLNLMQWACVMVEADWRAIRYAPPGFSQLNPKTVGRSIDAWMMRFPRVHWITEIDRRHAEARTFQLLRRFWKEDQGK